MPERDTDIKISDGTNTRRYRLLTQGGRKAWTVQEVPPRPNVESAAAAREGLPVDQLLPFDGQDFSWGVGLQRFTPQADRPGHVLRYADGFGIDTTEPGKVKHGPLVSTVGTTSSAVIQALIHIDEVWFLTNEHLYSWDGTTLTLEWTNPDGAVNTEMEVHGDSIFIAASNTKYWHTTGIGSPITITSKAFATDHFLSLGGTLYRTSATNQFSSSIDPSVSSPTWAANVSVGDGDSVRNLFSISGLVGVETASNVFIIDSDLASIELNKGLRNRRAATSGKRIKSETGSDVWFSDGFEVRRLISVGFELFDIGPDGPFHSTDERPVTAFPDGGDPTYLGITQDLSDVYIAVSRAQGDYIYKGKELSRNIYSWTPLVKDSTAGTANFIAALKTSGDSSTVVYYNQGTTVRSFETKWTTYATDWELDTAYFTATLPAWDKMWDKVSAFLDRDTTDAKVTVSRRLDIASAFSLFGASGEMTDNGSNEVLLSTPLNGKQIQLRFAGNTSDTNDFVHLHSFLLEGYLRADYRRTLQFTVIADSKEDTTFLEGLRTTLDSFITITDRFNVARTVVVLPGSPVEEEVTDEVRKEPVRAYRIVAQEKHT